MFIDFHVHSSHTQDVPFSAAELIAQAKKSQLDGFCLTDVHTVAGGPECKSLAAAEGLVVLVGFEALTERGHFLVFVPEPDQLPDLSTWVPYDNKGRAKYAALAKAVSARNGVLIAAHPYDRDSQDAPGDTLVQLKGISAIEVLNGARPKVANDLAEELAAGIGLPGVGGSDSRKSIDSIGKISTLLSVPVKNEAELIEQILAGDIWPVSIGELATSAASAGRRRRNDSERGARSPRRDDRGGKRGGRSSSRGGRPTDRNRRQSKKPPRS